MNIAELTTPALLVESSVLDANISSMSKSLPGPRLRPHVKAHKCTALAARQAAAGHLNFTCATVREVEGMARAGLGHDLLLANEVLDASRLARLDARVTVAVDSEPVIEAAVKGGIGEVVIDVNVGLPRCGCAADEAGRLADLARSNGLEVRGVMGYEGHAVVLEARDVRQLMTEQSMEILVKAHEDVGGDLISAGGTGTYDINTWANEIQAGSYVLMDTAYQKLGLPFGLAVSVLATVIHVSPAYAVIDCGLKALGMDHGEPTIRDAQVWFVSDEHITFAPEKPLRVGDRVRVFPAHIDPTVAYHDHLHLVKEDEIVESWPVDLRGW